MELQTPRKLRASCTVYALANNKETHKVEIGDPNPRLSSDYRVHAILTHTHITTTDLCVYTSYTQINMHCTHTKDLKAHLYTFNIHNKARDKTR